jgi:hypothetical protein
MRCFATFEPETQEQICIFFTNTVNITAYNYDEAISKVTTQHMVDIDGTELVIIDSNWQPLTTQQLSDSVGI